MSDRPPAGAPLRRLAVRGPRRRAVVFRPVPAVDPQLVEDFRRDGVVLLRGVLAPEQVATLAAGVERNLAEPARSP